MLSRTLRLIITIQDLASANKSLRAEWQNRQMPVLTLVKNLIVIPLGMYFAASACLRGSLLAPLLDDARASIPRSICRELALNITQGLPASLMDENTLSTVSAILTPDQRRLTSKTTKMCHLLTDSSCEVQKMAYRFLQEAAKRRTECIVIEAAVDTAGVVKIDLPPELMDLLQRNLYDRNEMELDGQVDLP